MAAPDAPICDALRQRLRGLNIYLVGMMGCGKSATGRVLSEQLNYRFFDTDTLIERIAGQPIAQLFETEGEAVFRQLESQTLNQLAAYQRSVVATGGGIVLDSENWNALRHGAVVWIDPPISVMYRRLAADRAEIERRPLLHGDDPEGVLAALRDRRVEHYQQADVRIEPTEDDDAAAVADRAIAALATVIEDPQLEPPNPDLN